MTIMAVVQGGSTGAFFSVSITESVRVRDAPVTHTVTGTVIAVYVFDICNLAA